LEKLEDFQSSEYMTVINLFGNIWGCGPNIAKTWYDQVGISFNNEFFLKIFVVN